MQVVVTGLSHETAPLAVRERVAVPCGQLPRALAALRAVPGVREVAILSTCNRTELYVAAAPEFAVGSLGHFLRSFHDLPPGAVGETRMYTHQGTAAATHLCGVAAGLASAVLGETQILAQVKEAYQIATAQGTLGPYLHQLFKLAIATAKEVQTDTALGLNALSMGSTAMQMIRRTFRHLDRLQVLVVGTGKMGRLVLCHVAGAGVAGITLASRDPVRAREVALGTGARCVALADVPALLPEFDVVVTATTGLVLTTGDVRRGLAGGEAPFLLIDLGVPRNVDPAVSELPQVQLLNVDDLKQVTEANLDSRRQAVHKAREIVDRGAERFEEWLQTRMVVPLISTLTEEAERIRRQELERALARLGSQDQQHQVALEELTRSLMGRLLHECTVTLKRGATGRDAVACRSQ